MFYAINIQQLSPQHYSVRLEKEFQLRPSGCQEPLSRFSDTESPPSPLHPAPRRWTLFSFLSDEVIIAQGRGGVVTTKVTSTHQEGGQVHVVVGVLDEPLGGDGGVVPHLPAHQQAHRPQQLQLRPGHQGELELRVYSLECGLEFNYCGVLSHKNNVSGVMVRCLVW